MKNFLNKFKWFVAAGLSVFLLTIGFIAYAALIRPSALSDLSVTKIQKGQIPVGSSTPDNLTLINTSTSGSVLSMGSNGLPSFVATSTLGLGGSGVSAIASTTSGNLFYGNISGSTLTQNFPINLINNISTGTAGTIFNIATSSTQSTNSLVINLPIASSVNTGQLSSTDWSTFNNKQNTITNPVTGTGVAGQVPYWSSASALSGNPGFLFSNASTTLSLNSSTPNSTFVVQGSSTAPTLPVFTAASSTSTALLTVLANGNVGIGTAAPTAPFSVANAFTVGSTGNFSTTGNIFNFLSAGTNIIGVNASGAGAALQIYGGGNAGSILDLVSTVGVGTTDYIKMRVGNNGAMEAMRITSNGAIGISSSSPNATLVVQGTTTNPSLDIFRAASSTGQTYFTINNVGNVTMTNASTTNLSASGAIFTSIASGNCLQAGTNGIIASAGAACGSGGSGNSAWTIGNAVIYNATSTDAVGVGFSTPTATFHIQGNGTANLFQINSSTGVSLLRVNPNGSLAIGTTTNQATLVVQGTSTLSSLDMFRIASSSGITQFSVTNGNNVNIATVSASTLLATDAGKNIQSVTIATGTAGTAPGLSFANSTLTLNCPNASATNIGCLNNTDWSTFNNKQTAITVATNTTGSLFTATLSAGTLTISIPNASASATGSLTSTDWTTFNNKQSTITNPVTGTGVLGKVASWSSASAVTTGILIDNGTVAGVNASSATVSLLVQGTAALNPYQVHSSTGAVILTVTPGGNIGINSTTPVATLVAQGTTTQPALDIFRAASSTGTTLLSDKNLGSTTVTTLSASNLTNGNCVQAGASGLLTSASAACGTALSGGTLDKLARWTSTSALSTGITIDNNVVAGFNASSATVSLLVQGTTTLNPFQINTSTAAAILRVSANGSLGVGTTTNTSTLFVQGTSTLPTINLFNVASSNGISVLSIANTGDISFQGVATSSTAFVGKNPSGQTVMQMDMTATAPGITIGTNTAASLYPIAQLVVQGNSASTTMPLAVLASSTNTQILSVLVNGSVGVNSATPASMLAVAGNSNLPTFPIFTAASSTNAVALYVGANSRVGINTTTPPFGLTVATTLAIPGATQSGSSQTYYICGAASTFELLLDTTTCLVSARKFKKDIHPLDLGISEFMQLQPVWYKKKQPLNKNDAGEQPGFIADDVAKIDTRFVTYDLQGQIHGFRYEQFTAWITKALQDVEHQTIEVMAKNNEQDIKLAEQQKEIDALKRQVNLLLKLNKKGK